MTYAQTLDFLFKQLPMYQQKGEMAYKKDLTNITALCSLLQHPEQQFKSIHIAGTNGKGSTAHMLSSVLQEAGYKVGLYTSPHLKDFRERIRINGNMISKDDVVNFVDQFHAPFQSIQPSFFEWSLALAFYTFAKEKVDIAVIETGLGGRLDSTNIINPELSIITNIGFDHVQMLGDTLEKIAGEKAGIIKKQTPVVVVNHSGEKEVFLKKAQTEDAPITFVNELVIPEQLETDLKGNYQLENIRGVYTAIQQLKKQGWNITDSELQNGLLQVAKNTQLRGRWEILQKSPTVIAETAHNIEGLTYALAQLKAMSKSQIHFVLGFVKDKNITKALSLFPKDGHYYFCKANIDRALPQQELLQQAKDQQLNGKLYESVPAAYNAALRAAQPSDVVYIGGSNFVVAEVL